MCWLVHRATIMGFDYVYRIDDRRVLFIEKNEFLKKWLSCVRFSGCFDIENLIKTPRQQVITVSWHYWVYIKCTSCSIVPKRELWSLEFATWKLQEHWFAFLYILDHWVSLRPDNDMRSSNPEMKITQKFWGSRTMS